MHAKEKFLATIKAALNEYWAAGGEVTLRLYPAGNEDFTDEQERLAQVAELKRMYALPDNRVTRSVKAKHPRR
jgi:hypothetical protein